VKDRLKRFGLFEQLGERRFFPTIEAAVSAHRGLTRSKSEQLEHA
jgi:hypothetical protein